MIHSRGFIAGLIAWVLVGVLAGWLKGGDEEIVPVTGSSSGEEFPKAVSQVRLERSWRSISGDKVWTLGTDDAKLLLKPLWVKADCHGYAYVFDAGDFVIKKYTPDGKLIQKFGYGKGNGPGELSSPQDFAVDKDGNVWVTDIGTVRVTIFDHKGRVLKTLRPNSPSMRIVILKGGRHFVLSPSSKLEDQYELYGIDSNSLRTFGRFIADQTQNYIALGGRIVPDEYGGFVEAFSRSGYIVAFDTTGKIRFFRETIDQIPFPKLIPFGEGGKGRRIDRRAPWTSISLSIVADEIYVLCIIESYKAKAGVIDVYDAKEGSYLYSFKLPDWSTYAFVTKDYVYSIVDTTVTKWKR